VQNVSASKDREMIAYVVSDTSKNRALVVPNFLDEFVQASNVRRGWSEQKVFATPADGSRERPFEIKLPTAEGVSNFRRIVWAADNRSLIVDRNDKDTKRRQLFYVHNVGSKDEQTILVTEETDDKWQAPCLRSSSQIRRMRAAFLLFGKRRL
jgi:protease II